MVLESILSIIVAIVVILIVWAFLKFVLKLTARIIGCTVTILIAGAIVVVGLIIVL